MRSSLRISCGLSAGAIAVLAGCATPASDLPRYVRQTSELGYAASTGATTNGATSAISKNVAMITRSSWNELNPQERSSVEQTHEVRIVEIDQYGVIIDVQGADQSTPGTNAGAAVGGAVASAAYIDKAWRGGNYSATGNLAMGLLGAALGSSMDSRPTSQFQFRYTIKLGDGEFKYFDEVKTTQFRHSVGVCVVLPSITLVSQQVCNQTPDTVRKRFLPSN